MKILPTAVLLSAMLGLTVLASDDIFVRVAPPTVPCWVGEQVLVPITVGLVERPNGSPQFRLPAVGGAVLAMIPGPIYGSEERDGVAYTTWTYSLAFYAHRAGTHTVSTITVDARVPHGNGSWRQVRASSEPFALRARLPEAAQGLATLVTTKALTVDEVWKPDQTEWRVGDAITRTVTLRAPDMLGIGFPPLRFETAGNVAVYPEPPRVDNEIHRGDVTGLRVDTVVYVCEREGTATLPPLVVPWFNPKTEAMNRHELPGRKLRIVSNPAFAKQPSSVTAKRGRAGAVALRWLTGLLVAGCGGFLVFRFAVTFICRVGSRIAAFRRWLRDPLPPLNPVRCVDEA